MKGRPVPRPGTDPIAEALTVSRALSVLPLRPATLPDPHSYDLYETWLAGRPATTRAAYRAAWLDFARFLAQPTPGAAADLLVRGEAGQANAVVLGFKAALLDRDLAPTTIALRLAAIRSLVKFARLVGRIPWVLEVPSPQAVVYRDTTGPGLEGWRLMLARAKREAESGRPEALRNLALVRLLRDMGLRRNEAAALDLADVDFEGSVIHVMGKGRLATEPLTMPPAVADAIAHWLDARGRWEGPLFVALHPGGRNLDPARLVGRGLMRVVAQLARRAGLKKAVRPHGLRHEAITRALDVAGGNLREVRKFSRHAKLETLIRYDDNRADLGGAIAKLISEE